MSLHRANDHRRRGGTRKIADLPDMCRHPAHHPPCHMVYTPGVYEHVCPGCGARHVFTVRGPVWFAAHSNKKGMKG